MANVKVGDLVRILPNTWAVKMGLAEVGEIVEIAKVYEDGSGVAVNTSKDNGVVLGHTNFAIFETKKERNEAPEMVEHPAHYKQGRFETIELIEEITKGYGNGYIAYCVGNAVKYLARAPFKHETPLEDLQKAKKYLEFAIAGLEEK